jgi:hypothetical protein
MRSGCTDPHFLDLDTSWRSCSCPGERGPSTLWIGDCVGPRAGLDAVEKRRFLTLPGLELWPLSPAARIQYPVSISTVLSRLLLNVPKLYVLPAEYICVSYGSLNNSDCLSKQDFLNLWRVEWDSAEDSHNRQRIKYGHESRGTPYQESMLLCWRD